jgi:hypothetical protein
VFLHFVLDEWFEREVKPRLKGTLLAEADSSIGRHKRT